MDPNDYLANFSVENLLRQAFAGIAPTPVADPGQVPAEYAPLRAPAPLQAEAGAMLGAMGAMGRRLPTSAPSGDRSNAALGGWKPPLDFRSTGTPIPVVGRDIGLPEIEEWIRKKESSGNYQALNREQAGNTASGAYQYTDSTWNGYGGYPKAMLAPKHIQDKRFREDVTKRAAKFRGDPFKMIAAHYLPAAADNPNAWMQPYKLKNGKTVKPVAQYVAYVVKGTPLEKSFNEYMARAQ